MGMSLIGNPQTHLLERRVLNAALFGSSIITSLLFIQSLIIGFSYQTIISIFIFSAIFWLLYWFGKTLEEHTWLPWVYLGINQFIIIFDWIYMGGFSGAGLMVLLIVTGLMPLFLKKNQMRWGIGISSMTAVIIGIGFTLSPDRVLRHVPNEARVWERLTEVVILAVGICIVSILVINAYRKEREMVDRLNETLKEKNDELVIALNEVKTLQGMIPICSSCKKIRNDTGFYESVEEYIGKRTDADFSHTVCPECTEKLYGQEEWYQKLRRKKMKKKVNRV